MFLFINHLKFLLYGLMQLEVGQGIAKLYY